MSRCRSLEGIVAESPINLFSIAVDKQVVDYSSMKPNGMQISAELKSAKEQFRTILVLQLFDFSPLHQMA